MAAFSLGAVSIPPWAMPTWAMPTWAISKGATPMALGWGIALGIVGLLAQPGLALPGQSIPVAESWIRNNPTLSPAPNERLSLNRTPSPGQRFSFQASLFPVAGAMPTQARRIIRTERFTLVDHANAITVDRLEESLRLIYGPQIFNDYRQGDVLFEYPGSSSPDRPNLILVGAVRSGERFAYWYELAYGETGTPYLGRMAIFLKEDLPLLRDHLTSSR